MIYHINTERESDGRWVAEVVEMPGVLKYAQDRDGAVRAVKALSLRVLAARLDTGEVRDVSVFFVDKGATWPARQ